MNADWHMHGKRLTCALATVAMGDLPAKIAARFLFSGAPTEGGFPSLRYLTYHLVRADADVYFFFDLDGPLRQLRIDKLGSPIDGVRIGDAFATVTSKLGSPVRTWTRSSSPSLAYRYKTTAYGGTSVDFYVGDQSQNVEMIMIFR